ncbi:Dam family site-specific DNA-(adenine-N6)-methyltransferase [Lactobacillus delbrueckii]|uniref:Site-specific DNA-methyltransferase (adenine-specific) n=1 Tax=Lactobacillus delbrueckii TaxID=1584 RepID=A0ABD4W2X5_9LACO|nr:Dam family site-specific DNA-(adenine-N6)-methyltransferase [Lactobacillus delbrueckii]MDA3778051.1 Dam family site-specific DNA-(adenine-N6)-methyltransferase [Lactobacillus delbrueckii]MDA3782946.1 Dam family site-specific DNA-(adenine-N6)-methyltransferase [Lactobacillus delbrueckii]MDA3794929.1 Dam family site-specific DNA-(adenine-N6)-methyltransferase [Lactobacillus delbrueckii]MDA3842170.1 Dam family site-specific DNA-(adenine-N6)-methyltransferase [Lactobacillus delbrueckii]
MRYIGSKKNLLSKIDTVLKEHLDGSEKNFVDLFGGSNVVGEFFANRYQIISNDIMYFSYAMARGSLGLNNSPAFELLEKSEKITDPLKYLTSVDLKMYDGDYVTESFSPAGEAKRMYFTIENAKRIDFIRQTIEDWKKKKLITEDEYFYLLNSLLQTIPFVSNITGTYGAYLKRWDKRAFKQLILEEPSNLSNHKYQNKEYNEDSQELMRKIEGPDIVYIDPPYNSRQYSSNYHVLENIAKWEKPVLKGITGQPIFDEKKSDFATKRKAKSAMQELLNSVNAKHVLISYSTDGIISKADLIEMIKPLAKNDQVDVYEIEYRKYKSKIHNNNAVYELLFYYQPKAYTNKKQISLDGRKEVNRKTEQIMAPKGFIKSPLNYVGGKYKLLPQILPLFPDDISTFVDMFSGGANVGINVKAKKIIFNDINNKVNGFFRYIQNHPVEEILNDIYDTIRKYQLTKTNELGFKALRTEYNKNPDPISLYVLVSYSFNYQFRFNNRMEYNNPFGKNRSHFSERMEKNLIQFMEKLQSIDAVFIDKEFSSLDLSSLDENSFVYADPPYLITTGSYNDGNRGFINWTDKQEQELYRLLDSLNKKNIRFAMSNVLYHKGKENYLLKQWSKKYNIHHLNYDYKNASYNTSKRGSDEVLITNY